MTALTALRRPLTLGPAAGGLTAGTTACAIVGTSFAASDAVTAYPLGAGQAARYLLAALVLTVLLRGRLGRPTARQLATVSGVAALGLVGFNLCVLGAVQHAAPGTVGAIVGACPVLLALGGPLARGERPPGALVVAAVVVALGAAVIERASGGGAAGIALACGALLCEAAFSLLAARVVGALGPVRLSAWACWLGALGMAALIPVTGAPVVPTATETAALLYLAGPVTVGAFVLWYASVGRLGVERAGLLVGVMPVAALAAGVALGAETAGSGRLLGVLLVVGGVLLGLRPPRRAARPRWTGAA